MAITIGFVRLVDIGSVWLVRLPQQESHASGHRNREIRTRFDDLISK